MATDPVPPFRALINEWYENLFAAAHDDQDPFRGWAKAKTLEVKNRMVKVEKLVGSCYVADFLKGPIVYLLTLKDDPIKWSKVAAMLGQEKRPLWPSNMEV